MSLSGKLVDGKYIGDGKLVMVFLTREKKRFSILVEGCELATALFHDPDPIEGAWDPRTKKLTLFLRRYYSNDLEELTVIPGEQLDGFW